MKIRKNDTVKVLYGKDKGTQAKVLKVARKEAKVYVEGVNTYNKWVKNPTTNEGELVTLLKPVHTSKIMLVCKSCGKPTRVGIDKSGDVMVRICKKCGKDVGSTSSPLEGKNDKTKKKASVKSVDKKKKTSKVNTEPVEV